MVQHIGLGAGKFSGNEGFLPGFSETCPKKTPSKKWPQKKLFILFWAIFAQIFWDFVKVFRYFAQISRDFPRILTDFARNFHKSKLLVMRLHHLHSRLLHQ